MKKVLSFQNERAHSMTLTIEPWGRVFEISRSEEIVLEMEVDGCELPFWEILSHKEGLSLYFNGQSPAFRLLKGKTELTRFE